MTTILVVDDELSIATMLGDVLEEAGYQVLLAKNGREALDALAVARPAVVVTDMMMPIMDGESLCRAMQADPVHQAIPIIATSAVPKALTAAECVFAAFVPKPFDIQLLLDTIAVVAKLAREA
jgi:two-component system response regulator VicR